MDTMDPGHTEDLFLRERRIRFSDCDPAGIVFYPQYFVMLNGHVEDWISDGLGIGYATLIAERRIGLPMVRMEADFRAVSRLGDSVCLRLGVERLGQRSITLLLSCTGPQQDDLRMRARQVIVTTSLETHRAIPVPEDLRLGIARARSRAA